MEFGGLNCRSAVYTYSLASSKAGVVATVALELLTSEVTIFRAFFRRGKLVEVIAHKDGFETVRLRMDVGDWSGDEEKEVIDDAMVNFGDGRWMDEKVRTVEQNIYVLLLSTYKILTNSGPEFM